VIYPFGFGVGGLHMDDLCHDVMINYELTFTLLLCSFIAICSTFLHSRSNAISFSWTQAVLDRDCFLLSRST
jgi:hypothetical protein